MFLLSKPHHQTYRQKLSEFRSSLPRQHARGFKETGDTSLIRGQLADINGRFDKLRGRYAKHGTWLKELSDKHQVYEDSVQGVSSWLEKAETKLDQMKAEPIGANKETIIRQIEKAEVRTCTCRRKTSFCRLMKTC